MLRSIKEKSGSWFIKVLFSAIIISFAFFGIGDMIKTYSSSKTVASVSGEKISIQEFNYALKKEMIKLQSSSGLSIDQIKSLGIESKVLEDIINKKAIDAYIKKNNIKVPKQILVDYIKSIKFLQENGTFDPNLFKRLLQTTGISEASFLHEIERDVVLQQLSEVWSDDNIFPDKCINLISEFLSENRSFLIMQVENKKPKSILEDDINKFFIENKEKYVVPEKREFELAYIAQITNDEIERYKREHGEVQDPELYKVLVVETSDKIATDFILSNLEKNLLNELSKKNKVNEKIYKKSELPECAKNLKITQHTSETSGNGITTFYYIKDITQPKKRILSNEEIKSILTKERSQNSEKAIRDKIDDAIAAGDAFAKIVDGFPIIKTGLIGKAMKFCEDTDLQKIIVDEFWDKNEGHIQLIDHNGGFVVIHLLKKVDKRVPELFEVIKDVEYDLKEKKKKEDSLDLAKELIKKINNVASLTKIAEENGFKVISGESLSHTNLKNAPTLKDSSNLDAILDMEKEESIISITKDKVYIVMCIKKSADDKSSVIKQNIKKMIKEDFFVTGLNSIKKDVEIDQSLIKFEDQ